MKTEYRFNIDKLKVSFVIDKAKFSEFTNYYKDEVIDYKWFQLKITDDGKKTEDVPSTYIEAELLIEEFNVGLFTFNYGGRMSGRAFFEFANQALYTKWLYPNCNYVSVLPQIADCMGLNISTITTLEIALDSNKNTLLSIKKIMKDVDNYATIYNDKEIAPNEVMKGALQFNEFTLTRTLPNGSRKFAQSEGLELEFYDKTREIDNSDKQYILKWNDFVGSKLYRTEMRANWKQLKKWFDHLNDSGSHYLTEWKQYLIKPNVETNAEFFAKTYELLSLPQYIQAIWEYLANRIIHFREKTSRQTFGIYDVVITP